MPKYNDFDLDIQNLKFEESFPMEEVGSDDITGCTSGVYTDVRSNICTHTCPHRCNK